MLSTPGLLVALRVMRLQSHYTQALASVFSTVHVRVCRGVHVSDAEGVLGCISLRLSCIRECLYDEGPHFVRGIGRARRSIARVDRCFYPLSG